MRYAFQLAGPDRGTPFMQADRVVLEVSASLGLIGFVLGLRVGCMSIADDLRVGAFQFYFSRTIRPADYVLGKLLGVALVVAIPMLGAPLVLTIFRLLLSDTWSESWTTAAKLPGAVIFGLAGTAAYALPAAACGALMQRRLAAQALYAGFYLIGQFMIEGVAEALEQPLVRALEPGLDVVVIGQDVFDVAGQSGLPPTWAAVAVLALYGLAGVLLVHRRVARAETAGLGGG
jgi:hypothetical protein